MLLSFVTNLSAHEALRHYNPLHLSHEQQQKESTKATSNVSHLLGTFMQFT